VHFRDLQNILGHLVHLWFFASPVLYYYGARTGKARCCSASTRCRTSSSPTSRCSSRALRPLARPVRDRGGGALAFRLGAFLFDRLRDTLAEEV
jgi:hypothetical protein